MERLEGRWSGGSESAGSEVVGGGRTCSRARAFLLEKPDSCTLRERYAHGPSLSFAAGLTPAFMPRLSAVLPAETRASRASSRTRSFESPSCWSGRRATKACLSECTRAGGGAEAAPLGEDEGDVDADGRRREAVMRGK